MNLDKLKEAARRHELRDEWRKAIEIYHRALADLAQAGEPADPSLHNRIGDLEVKAGDLNGALQAYEHAVDAYADQGFFNNAIALCGKILRVDPARTVAYLRLAELHARKNVAGEVRRNLTEYIGHMGAGSQQPVLAESLRKFAERFALSIEQRNLLAEVLRDAPRTQQARETVDQLAADLGLGEGHTPADGLLEPDGGNRPGPGGLVFIDTGIMPVPGRMGSSFGSDQAPPAAELPGNTIVAFEADMVPAAATLDFIEPTVLVSEPTGTVPPTLEGFEPTRLGSEAIDLDLAAAPLALEATEPEPVEIPGLDIATEFLAPGPLAGSGLSPDLAPGPAAPLPMIPLITEALFDELDVEEEALAATIAGRPELETSSDGELEGIVARAAAEERWDLALLALAELLRRSPDAIPRHQKRVEVAYRSGDRLQLVGAYLSLAQALERAGALENARMVYERVLEHDAANPVAEAAVTALTTVVEPAPPVPETSGKGASAYVDLGALILEPEPERDTRMRVDQGEPESEEDVDFRETLEQFKQGIAANLDADDFEAHYDLGIAFKEMGLLDEAIAQFQKALRAPGGKLKSSEALGIAFFEKGRYAIAETVLARAIETLPGGDDEKIGLVYWLGRTCQEQGRPLDALRCYERALAVDITFLDLSDRVQRLTAERLP
ncbi:MAG TPA: tetratricopeptide repeat protein [Gemmatimonadales bacterium]